MRKRLDLRTSRKEDVLVEDQVPGSDKTWLNVLNLTPRSNQWELGNAQYPHQEFYQGWHWVWNTLGAEVLNWYHLHINILNYILCVQERHQECDSQDHSLHHCSHPSHHGDSVCRLSAVSGGGGGQTLHQPLLQTGSQGHLLHQG